MVYKDVIRNKGVGERLGSFDRQIAAQASHPSPHAQAPPHPECFAERGSKLLKTKGWSAEKSAKRGTRGSKLLRTWDLPQRHGDTEGLNKRIAPPPPVFL